MGGQVIESWWHAAARWRSRWVNIVCFPLRGANAGQRDAFLERLKEDEQVLLTPTFYAGKAAIRAAFANWSTSERDVSIILEALERCARG